MAATAKTKKVTSSETAVKIIVISNQLQQRQQQQLKALLLELLIKKYVLKKSLPQWILCNGVALTHIQNTHTHKHIDNHFNVYNGDTQNIMYLSICTQIYINISVYFMLFV